MKKIRNMEEFSTASGISRPTLSKYFSNPDSVRQSTRTRIEKALSSFDYRPNFFAINQNRRNPRNIGIIVPQIIDPFFAELVRKIETRCIEEGYWAIVLSSHGDPDLEGKAIDTLLSLKISGAVVASLGTQTDERRISQLAQTVPVVLLDSRHDQDVSFVGTDNFQSISVMVDYLCRTGERPCFLEMPDVNSNASERREGYVRAMQRLGLQPEVVPLLDDGWNFEELGFRTAEKKLGGDGFPTRTVLCANDRLAIGVLAAACARKVCVGIEGGCELRVAGHDDHPMSRYTCPALTTIAQDYAGLASRSIEILLSTIDESQRSGVTRVTDQLLEGRLILRSSA